MTLLLLANIAALQIDTATSDSVPADVRCGAYCLYVALKGLGVSSLDFDPFEQSLGPPSPHGYSLLALGDAVAAHGAHHAVVKTNLDTIEALTQSFACIALLKHHHYVAVVEIAGDDVHVIDPPNEYVLNRAQFEEQWDGTVLLISASPIALPKPGLSLIALVGVTVPMMIALTAGVYALLRYSVASTKE